MFRDREVHTPDAQFSLVSRLTHLISTLQLLHGVIAQLPTRMPRLLLIHIQSPAVHSPLKLYSSTCTIVLSF
jgi:hypothetical protein